ncbi:phosphotransferase [Cohnella faecalis]|uniref:Aminoglycoside phosphotransferase domain-containing protein n=1 Tax=Cohnella faecalis TaxID=2315694 RepID=A0A398CD76_9BACL|nr:phosphotransferase [Cohnella faecalis]RIE01136.1 hypothetical protein D3H35_22245 [Cohnella faecalis]
MIPECLSAYRLFMPMLDEVAEWSLLRQWSLSEVYRAILKTGETRIIKWGGKEMAGEAVIYRQLVSQLQIKAPEIFEFFEANGSTVMVMEDAGKYNLEQQPYPRYFLEAARELANLRATAAANLARNIPGRVIRSHTVSVEDFLALLDDLLQSPCLSERIALAKLKNTFPYDLAKLYRTSPLTLVHHDYQAKNLLVQADGILPIDWSIAYLSPHLGDLYCLIADARTWSGVSREEILSAFLSEAGNDLSIEQLNWHIRIGGLCWLVKTLRWLVYGGTAAIPGSDAWIPDLMNQVEKLVKEAEEEGERQ